MSVKGRIDTVGSIHSWPLLSGLDPGALPFLSTASALCPVVGDNGVGDRITKDQHTGAAAQ
jgi:hypothetical protein